MIRPSLGGQAATAEGVDDYNEAVTGGMPMADRQMLEVLTYISHRQGPNDGRVWVQRDGFTEIETIKTHEVEPVTSHEDCEICGGHEGYLPEDIENIAFQRPTYNDDGRVNGLLIEARIERNDSGDWVLVPGESEADSTRLREVTQILGSATVAAQVWLAGLTVNASSGTLISEGEIV